ncbi:hypothetical protein P168DRAFT_293619 [Aspergillus campestris IBT 28561]|uniref:Uncharacterized protein n=1 Tax=Aspergillus campestris (strain IBT 28561) TaxID=1392248 RepID=A0A2I1CRV2_ASPC2|nr:uncharacterized protein P168DRAFT_293619 [Aspergillus campestris IBT 28561]PKY00351.1 hypothetical protein P168DRAFT_293619 [Aspergillus campestris IBT 28561]
MVVAIYRINNVVNIIKYDYSTDPTRTLDLVHQMGLSLHFCDPGVKILIMWLQQSPWVILEVFI